MSPLHVIGDFFRDLFLQVPLGVVRALFVLLIGALLVWVLLLPRQAVTPPTDSPRLSENLKVWAAVALILQLFFYLLL